MGIVETVWHRDTRASKVVNSDKTHGTEGVAIRVVMVSDFARNGASRSADSGSKDVNEARLGGSIISALIRDGLEIFILWY